MEKKVPTVEVEIGKGEDLKKILLYQWMTQEEEDKYNAILLGDKEYTQDEYKEMSESGGRVSLVRANEAKRYLIEIFSVTPWEEVNAWKPSLRNEIEEKIEEIRSKN